jgi:hypothetical protein
MRVIKLSEAVVYAQAALLPIGSGDFGDIDGGRISGRALIEQSARSCSGKEAPLQ